jgi:hypothetical protein
VKGVRIVDGLDEILRLWDKDILIALPNRVVYVSVNFEME